MEQYADLPVGIIVASVVIACERLGVRELATLDHRHSGAIQPRHVAALELAAVGLA